MSTGKQACPANTGRRAGCPALYCADNVGCIQCMHAQVARGCCTSRPPRTRDTGEGGEVSAVHGIYWLAIPAHVYILAREGTEERSRAWMMVRRAQPDRALHASMLTGDGHLAAQQSRTILYATCMPTCAWTHGRMDGGDNRGPLTPGTSMMAPSPSSKSPYLPFTPLRLPLSVSAACGPGTLSLLPCVG